MPQKSITDVNTKSAVTLVSLVERFGHSEDACRTYLEHLRWPEGVRCPQCESAKVSKIRASVGRPRKDGSRPSRNQFECSSCRRQFSVTAGSAFHDSHLPLWKWFLATYLMVDSKKGVSANQLRRELGVSYKTAWYLCHRIRSAMMQADEPLSGTVEIDETYIGGRARSGSQTFRGRGGTGGKAMVLGAVERGGEIRLKVERKRRASTKTVAEFVADSVDGRARAIYTDQHPAYREVYAGDARHASVDHSAEEWVRGDVGTQGIESAWSLLKRSIVGSYHQLSAKHLPAYLDEFAFRFNNRRNPFLFRDTLLKLIEGEALTYGDLTKP